MLELLGINANIESIYALTAGNSGHTRPRSVLELRQAYLAYLVRTEGRSNYLLSQELQFVTGGVSLEKLINMFNVASLVDDRQYTLGSLSHEHDENEWRYEQATRTREALDRLTRQLPGFGPLFRLVMTVIFTAKADRIFGGTASNAIGALWVSPDPKWEPRDLDEFLVHELAHTLVFLDERRFGHFQSRQELPLKHTWTQSAIRGTLRPIDKSLHSIIVATEVLLVRDRLGIFCAPQLHPNDERLSTTTLAAINDMVESTGAQKILTDRSHQLLTTCQQRLESRAEITLRVE